MDKVQIHGGKIQEQIHGSVRVVSKLRHGRGRLRELLHRVFNTRLIVNRIWRRWPEFWKGMQEIKNF